MTGSCGGRLCETVRKLGEAFSVVPPHPGPFSLWLHVLRLCSNSGHTPCRPLLSLGLSTPLRVPSAATPRGQAPETLPTRPLATPPCALTPRPLSPQILDSLHRGVQQVEFTPALVACADARVPPQVLHGHCIWLLERAHFVGVLGHHQAGVLLWRDK